MYAVESRAEDQVQQVIDAWARERPDVDVASIAVITPLWRLGAMVMANRQATLATHDIDQSHLDVLGELRRSGPPYRLTMGELSRRCRVTPGASTQRVAAMERRGWVRRTRDEENRRTVHVELTDAGVDQLDAIFGEVMDADERILAGLGPRERADLSRLLRRWLSLREGSVEA